MECGSSGWSIRYPEQCHSGMDKKSLTEQDIRTKFITPAIVGEVGAGWDVMTQMREEYFFTAGRVIVRGKNYIRLLDDGIIIITLDQ